jgi:polyisoprenoid-binding protein YceI
MVRKIPRTLKLMALIALAAAFGAAAAPASAQEWALNKEKSKLTFQINAGGEVIAGEFQQFEAEIRFDPDHVGNAEISAAIDINTVSTGQDKVDETLRSKDWLDAQTYPAAGFQAKAVKPGGADGSYVLEGNLTIKGKTRPLAIPVSLDVDLGEARITGETVINRLDFGVGPAETASGAPVANPVRVALAMYATRLDN